MSDTWTPDRRPLFSRVVDDIVAQIRDGSLRPGQQVPSTRELAESHGVASMRAMRELQVRGATYGVAGRGTFVRPDAMSRLARRPSNRHCARCEEESSYTAHLVDVVSRCHQLADNLDAHASHEVCKVAAEVRRLASVLAGALMDHACDLDHSGTRHRHG